MNTSFHWLSLPILEVLCVIRMYRDDSCAHSTQKTAGNVKVNVGIDEELKMILDLDPDIIDLGSSLTKPVDILSGFPPFSGGWAKIFLKIQLPVLT